MSSQTIRQPRTPSPQPPVSPSNPVQPHSQYSSNTANNARSSLQAPATTGITPTARFSSQPFSTPNPDNIGLRTNRHVSLAAPNDRAAGDRLAEARASSPKPPGSAGMGGGFGLGIGSGVGSTGMMLNGAIGSGLKGGNARPASEYIGNVKKEGGSPDATETVDAWFNDLNNYESQLDALAAASMDQNFTDELSAIESWFRVLSENERTAALYQLMSHSTSAQIRFFQKVLHEMSLADPVSALLSPALGGSMQSQMEGRIAHASGSGLVGLKSPVPSGYPHSPSANQFLAPESAVEFGSPSAQLAAQRNRNKQNRISAPGTLQVSDGNRYLGGNLNDVIERGSSPGAESNGSGIDSRPKSTDFSGVANVPAASRSPRPAGSGHQDAVGLGLPNTGIRSPRFEDQFSPMVQGANWASMMNTPMLPLFGDAANGMSAGELASALANASLGNHGGNVVLEDAAKYKRRPQNAVVYNDEGEPIGKSSMVSPRTDNSGFATSSNWRSPLSQQTEFPSTGGLQGLGGLAGLGIGSGMGVGMGGGMGIGMGLDPANLAGLGMGIGSGSPLLGNAGFGASQGLYQSTRAGPRIASGQRRSPLLRQGENKPGTGGGAGQGAGVAGEDDVDERVLKDMAYWLRTLRLHKYTTNFQGDKWRDIVTMNDQQLIDKGVAALGARRKLLKVFANVRGHYKIEHPEGYLDELGLNADEAPAKDDTVNPAIDAA